MKRLIDIQQGLKSPKNDFNQFGNFQYRKASDILMNVKPLLAKTHTAILLSDDMVAISEKVLMHATATLFGEGGEVIATSSGFAELDAHKGMSREQCAGAASSYARKYALCGLFAIDDSSLDPDSLQVEAKRDIVIKYLRSNERAMMYYTENGRYTLDDLNYENILSELIKNKKIKL